MPKALRLKLELKLSKHYKVWFADKCSADFAEKKIFRSFVFDDTKEKKNLFRYSQKI